MGELLIILDNLLPESGNNNGQKYQQTRLALRFLVNYQKPDNLIDSPLQEVCVFVTDYDSYGSKILKNIYCPFIYFFILISNLLIIN